MLDAGVLIVNVGGKSEEYARELSAQLAAARQLHSTIVTDSCPVDSALLRTGCRVALLLVHAEDLASLKNLTASRGSALNLPAIAVVAGELNGQAQLLSELPIADFVLRPARLEGLLARINRLTRQPPISEIAEVKRELTAKYELKQLVGQNPVFCNIVEKIRQTAAYDVPVLLMGETGTGKELFARAIHYLSPRDTKPFVPVNCAAMPGELIENELFGHVRGAFTGATERKDGLIQTANKGTLFLDEIDSLPLTMQSKLLRFMDELEVKPLGSNRISKANVRIIAAGRSDLAQKVKQGVFRDDLFYRLHVVSFRLPPLRERADDIPVLAEHFLRKYSRILSKPIADFATGVLHQLARHHWPGNIRELENVIYRGVVMCQGNTMNLGDLNWIPLDLLASNGSLRSFKHAKAEAIEKFERQYLISILNDCAGNISQAARMAQKDRKSFWALLKKHKIEARQFVSEK